MRICFFMLKLFFYCCCVRARYWRALKQRFVFAVHGFMMRFHFLLCLCLFIAMISIFSQRQPPHIAIPLSLFHHQCVFRLLFGELMALLLAPEHCFAVNWFSFFIFDARLFLFAGCAALSLSFSFFVGSLTFTFVGIQCRSWFRYIYYFCCVSM